MKKFKITWYIGDVEYIKEILCEKIVEAENINSVEWITVLPENINVNTCYARYLLMSDTVRTIDYGSWTQFIKIEEME